MNARLGFAVLGAALALTAPAWADDVAEPAADAKSKVVWAADFDKAVEQAKKEKKDLLVDFTGSDWCGWCIKLHEEVFSQDDFLAAAQKDYVLVALDFPQDEAIKAKVPNPDRNAELSQKYAVGGFPTVLLMTPEGDVFGKTGYQAGGSASYVTHISKLRTDGKAELKTAQELIASIRASKGMEQVAACDKAIAWLAALPAESSLDVIRVKPVQAAFASDPENKTGVALKAARALFRAGAADAAVLAAADKLDPKNELGIAELALVAKCATLRDAETAKVVFSEIDTLFKAGSLKDKAVTKRLAIQAMNLAVHPKVMNDPEKAKEYAARVRDMGYEPNEDGLKTYVDKLLDETAKPAPEKTDK